MLALSTAWTKAGAGSKLKLIWSRFTISWITIIYSIVAIVHCFIQIGLQGNAFTMNAAAANELFSLLNMAHDGNETEGFAVFSGGSLRICYQVPNTVDTSTCPVIWESTGSSHSSPSVAINYMPGSDGTATITTLPASSSSISMAPSPTQSIPRATSVISSLRDIEPAPSPTVTIIVIQSSENDGFSDDDAEDRDEDEDEKNTTGVDSVDHPTETKQDNALEKIVKELWRPSRRKIQEVPESGPDGSSTGILVTGIPGSDSTVQLSNACIQTLVYPAQTLANTKREDITLIGFQIWVLGLSFVGLLNESIPHLFASMATQFLVAVWTIVQIFQTEHFRRQLIEFSVDSVCNPSGVLGNYWHNREMAEIASATLNGIVFILNALLHYNLMKLFGWQTFKRLGASLTINRVYKLVLIQSIAIQLALFFMAAAAALWFDQLYNGAVGSLATLGELYKAGIIVMFVLLIPWLTLGWFTIRREMRKGFLAFVLLNLVFVGLWAAIFDSTSFRWTFVLWPFFAVMVCVSGTLMLITLFLGIICRMNFGKGLPRYLRALEPADDGEYVDVEKSILEKVDFPDVDFLRRTSPLSSPVDEFLPPRVSAMGETGNEAVPSPPLHKPLSNLSRTPSQSSDASSITNGIWHRADLKLKRWVIE